MTNQRTPRPDENSTSAVLSPIFVPFELPRAYCGGLERRDTDARVVSALTVAAGRAARRSARIEGASGRRHGQQFTSWRDSV